MRSILLGLGIVVAVLAVGAQPSAAQTDFPFGSRSFCASGSRGVGSLPQCAYYTWEHCRAALQGNEHCFENPTLAWYRARSVQQGKQTRKRQVRKKPAY